MGVLMYQCGKFFGLGLPRQESNSGADCRTQGRGDVVSKFDGDALLLHELPQAVEIHSGFPGDLADGWQWCAFGLGLIPHKYAAEAQ